MDRSRRQAIKTIEQKPFSGTRRVPPSVLLIPIMIGMVIRIQNTPLDFLSFFVDQSVNFVFN